MTRESHGLTDRIGTLTPPTPDQARRAGLFAAEVARDVDEAREFVDMLGLREWL